MFEKFLFLGKIRKLSIVFSSQESSSERVRFYRGWSRYAFLAVDHLPLLKLGHDILRPLQGNKEHGQSGVFSGIVPLRGYDRLADQIGNAGRFRERHSLSNHP